MSADCGYIPRVLATVRSWWRAAAAWCGDNIVSVTSMIFTLFLGWAALLVLAIGVAPYVAWFMFDLITNVASGEWTLVETIAWLTPVGILLAVCIGVYFTVWRLRRFFAQKHSRGTGLGGQEGLRVARLVATPPLPAAYHSYQGQYPHDFLEAMAADLGPAPDETALSGVIETRWPQWRWATSGPCPREAAIHEAVHVVVGRALGGLVSKVEMFARGNAGATTYTLLLGAGQADTSMFRLCVTLAPHLWLSRDPGWDEPGPHGLDVPAPWSGRHSDGMCGCSDDLGKAAWVTAGMHAAGLTPTVWPGETVPVDGTGRSDLLAWASQRVDAILERNTTVVAEVAGLLLAALDEERTVRGLDLHDVLARITPVAPSAVVASEAGHTELTARVA